MKKIKRHFIVATLLFSVFTSCNNYEKIKLYPVSNESGSYGYIDHSGKLIIEFEYDFAHRFYNNRALVLKDGEAFYINKKGKILFKASIKPVYSRNVNDSNFVFEDVTYSKVNFKDISDIYFFRENLVAFFDTAHNAFGYIDTDGNMAIPPKFAVVNNFHEGLAYAKLKDSTSHIRLSDLEFGNKNKFGYINSTGSFVIEPIFYKASNFSQGKAFVNIRADNTFTETGFSLSLDGYVINKNGVTLSPNLMNTQAWAYSPDGFLPAYNFAIHMIFGTGYYFIDSLYNHFPIYNGEELFFSDIATFNDGVASVRVGEYWRVIDKDLNVIIDENFSNVKVCSEGLVPVKVNKKWKYLSIKGNYPFNLEFDSCNNFSNGLAYVETYDRNTTIKGYINKKGEYIWQKIFSNKKVRD
jgi:hypothetical protein